MPSDRDLSHLYPSFRTRVQFILQALEDYSALHMVGFKWIVVEGYRTAAYQKELYAKGRTKPGRVVTFCDGYKKKSKHQSSMAVDIAPQHGHAIDWHVAPEHWAYLAHLYRSQNLTAGADWEKIVDKPHGEWPSEDKATYAKARAWQKQNGL